MKIHQLFELVKCNCPNHDSRFVKYQILRSVLDEARERHPHLKNNLKSLQEHQDDVVVILADVLQTPASMVNEHLNEIYTYVTSPEQEIEEDEDDADYELDTVDEEEDEDLEEDEDDTITTMSSTLEHLTRSVRRLHFTNMFLMALLGANLTMTTMTYLQHTAR